MQIHVYTAVQVLSRSPIPQRTTKCHVTKQLAGLPNMSGWDHFATILTKVKCDIMIFLKKSKNLVRPL